MEVSVLNTSGKETGKKIDLPESIFSIEPNEHAVYLDVKLYLANQRQGTHKAKEKSEITGSTRKLKRQKGTGTARAGSIKSPVLRGGGRAFGPRPRSYSFKLNKKVKALARKSALTSKAQENNILILENFSFEAPKTKQLSSILSQLNIADKKSLIVVPEQNTNIYLSGRNLPKTNVVTASNVSTYDLLNAESVVLIDDSIQALEKILN